MDEKSSPDAAPREDTGSRSVRPSGNKLPRILSLKSSADISRLFKVGQRVSGQQFTLIWEKSDRFQYGIFVKKELGNSVKRNKLKRYYREAIRENLEKLEIDLKIAVVPRRQSDQPGFKEINAEISRIFAKLSQEG